MKYLILFVCAFIFENFYSQEVSYVQMKKEFDAASSLLKSGGVTQEFTTTIFKDKTDAVPLEQKRSRIWLGKGAEYRLEEEGRIIVQNNAHMIMIDSAQQEIYINKPDSSQGSGMIGQLLNDSVFKVLNVGRFEEKEYIKYTLSPKQSDGSSYTLYFSKATQLIYKVEILYAPGEYYQTDINDESLEQPLVVISYGKIEKDKETKGRFATSNWIQMKEGKDILANGQESFSLIDFRFKK